MRPALLFIFHLLSAGLLTAQAHRPAPSDSALLARLDATIEAAVVRGDTTALDTLYADDLRFTHSDGEIDGRRTWLERAAASRPLFRRRTVDSVTVELHGPLALTSGRLTVVPVGEPGYVVRFVRLYARQAGRWVLESHRSVELRDLTAR